MKSWLPILVLVATVAIAVRWLFPKVVKTETPRIVTVHDTVSTAQFDTVWRERTIEKVVKEVGEVVNLVESVTVTVVETVTVETPAICPQVLAVAEKVGGETILEGFTLQQDTARGPLLRRQFRSVYYTVGSLKAMAVTDTLPPLLTFYNPPSKPCGFWCQSVRVAVGAVGGYSVCKVEGIIAR